MRQCQTVAGNTVGMKFVPTVVKSIRWVPRTEDPPRTEPEAVRPRRDHHWRRERKVPPAWRSGPLSGVSRIGGRPAGLGGIGCCSDAARLASSPCQVGATGVCAGNTISPKRLFKPSEAGLGWESHITLGRP